MSNISIIVTDPRMFSRMSEGSICSLCSNFATYQTFAIYTDPPVNFMLGGEPVYLKLMLCEECYNKLE
jgi:hypothetical protein